jgi:hypothetical protein
MSRMSDLDIDRQDARPIELVARLAAIRAQAPVTGPVLEPCTHGARRWSGTDLVCLSCGAVVSAMTTEATTRPSPPAHRPPCPVCGWTHRPNCKAAR